MSDKSLVSSDSNNPALQRQTALSRWDNEGGAGPGGSHKGLAPDEVSTEIPELTNTELVQLRISRNRAGEFGDHVAGRSI